MPFKRAPRLAKSVTVKYSCPGLKKRSGSGMRSEAKARSEIDHVLATSRSRSQHSPDKKDGRIGDTAFGVGAAVRGPAGADTQAVRGRSQRAGNAAAVV